MYGCGLIIRFNGATASAGRGPETWEPRLHRFCQQVRRLRIVGMQHARNFLMIESLCQNGQMRGNNWNVESRGALFYEQLVCARFGWRKENSVGRIGRVFQSFIAAVHADESLDFVVVRREV